MEKFYIKRFESFKSYLYDFSIRKYKEKIRARQE